MSQNEIDTIIQLLSKTLKEGNESTTNSDRMHIINTIDYFITESKKPYSLTELVWED